MRGGAGMPPDYPMGGLYLFLTMFYFQDAGFIRGGGHNLAHASIRVIVENGGKFFTNSEVDKVIIKDGIAKGIKLVDGTEVEATQAVISSLDPYNLCFRLIGEEHLSPRICGRVRNLVRNAGTITWNGWALYNPPNYHASQFNPDINETFLIQLVDKDPYQLAREYAWRCLHKFPPPKDTSTLVCSHTLFDKHQAPGDMHKFITETFVIPADAISEKEWLQYKKDKVISEQAVWQSYAPNMTWSNIIDCFVNSPYDTMRLANMKPSGEEHVIADVPSQIGSFRPIPELAQHRMPIKKLYATGAAWPPQGIATSWQGYTCYKIIAEDYNLRKPWEEKGRAY
jgi:beta-carotene ketolase (CrtO type)